MTGQYVKINKSLKIYDNNFGWINGWIDKVPDIFNISEA